MRVFRSTVEKDNRGFEWSPKVHTTCPHCTASISFFTQLRDNACSYCHKELPFPSGMAKEQGKRIEYHVCAKADPESGPPDDCFVYMRQGD